MSKNVKSNNKNTKKSASKAKKSTRNNYKIESLEPRLMMDAEPLDPALESNLDIEQFDSYVEQIGSLSDAIGGKAVDALGQFNKFDFTQFGLADKANAAVEFVSDSAEQLKSDFADKVNNTLEKALKDLEKKYYADEVTLDEGKIKLADFVQDYVAEKAEGTGLTFAVEGSKLVVNYDIEYAKNVTGMGFDLADGRLELTSEGTALNTSAKLKAVIDLDKGGNGIILDEASDVGDFTVSVEELKVSVDNLGMKAKFMNIVLEEVDKDGEEGLDLSISYTSGSEVSQSVNLEFGLVNSGELPFGFKDGELLTVATVEGELATNIPDIQMIGNGLSGLFSGDVLKNLPFVKESSFTIGEQHFNLPQLIEKINDLWTKVSIALTSTVEPVQYFKDRVQLNLNTLKLNLQTTLGETYEEWAGLLDKLMVKAVGNGNEFYSLIGDPTEALHLMNLKNGTELSFVIAPKSLSLDSLDVGLTTFESLSADFALAFNVKVNVKEGSSISFAAVSLDECSLKMGAPLPESMWESVPVKLNNAKFNYDVKVKVDGSLESNVSFDSNSVDLVIGESTLYSSSNGSIKCANPGTEDQEWNFKLDKGIIGDLPFVFDGDEVIISKVDGVLAATLPDIDLRDSFKLENVVKVLSSAKIPFVGDDVQEKIKGFSACWNKLVMAIQGAMKQNENTVDISCKNLSSLISQLDKDGVVEATFSELNLKFGEESFNLLASIDEDLIVNLEENADEKNVLTLEFKINRETLSNRPDFGVFIPEDVEMDLAFAIDVKMHVAKSVANIYSVGLNYASVHLNKDDITSEINFGPLSVNIKEGKFDFGVKIDSQMNVTFDDKSKISLEDFELSFGSFKLENLSSDVSYTEENGQPTWSLNLNDDLEEKLKLLPVKIADSALKVTYVDSKWNFIAPKIELNDFEGDLSFESVLNAFESIVRNLNLNFDFKLGSKPVKLSDVAETIKESFFDKYVALKEYIGNFNADTKQRVLNLSGLADMLRENKEEFLSALNFSFEDVNENLLAGDIENPSVCLNPGKNEILLKFTPAFGIFDELDLGFTKLKNVEVSATFAIQITINIDDEGKCSFEVDVPKNALDFSFFVDGVKQFVYTKGDFDWKAFKSVQEFFENAATNFSIDSLFDEIVNFPLVGEFLNEKQFEFDGTKFNLTELLGKLRDSRNLIAFVLGDAFAFGEGDVMTLNVDVLKNNQLLNDKIEDFGKLFDSVDLTYGSEKLDLLKLDEATEPLIALNGENLHIVFKLNLGEQTLDLKLFKLNQTEFGLSLDCSLEIENKENKASIKKIDVSNVGLEAGCDEISLNVGVASATLTGCNFNVSKSFEAEDSSIEIKLAYESANVVILSDTQSVEEAGEFSYSNGGWNIPDAITGLVEGFNISADFSLETVLSALKGISGLPVIENKIPNVSDIVDNLDETWKLLLQSIRSTVSGGKLNFGSLQKSIEKIDGIKDILSELYVNDSNLLSDTALAKELNLAELDGGLKVKLKPNLNFNQDVDINLLGGELGLVLESSLEIDLNLAFKLDNNKFTFNDLSLDKATLKVTGKLNDDSAAINLGIVGVEIANVSFEIQLEIGKENLSPKINLVIGNVDLKIGGVVIQHFENLEFGYKSGADLGSGEWVIPDDLKRFMSFSSENMVQQVHMYLNTLQTALRNLVENRTKLDFLDGSIDKVVDICDKVEQLVYGFSEGTDEYGLLKYVDGHYEAQFEDVEGFVTRFNDAWNNLFFDGKSAAQEFCSLSGYVYEKKDASEKLILTKVGDSYCYQIGEAEPVTLEQNSDGKFINFPDGYTFKKNQLVFDLSFNLGKEFELNFAKSLSSFDVASVLTSGYVSVTGGAGIKFTVDVNFASPAIQPEEKAKSVLTALPDENKKYTVFALDDSKVNIESELNIEVVKQGEGSELATVNVKAGPLTDGQLSSSKEYDLKAELTSTNRICLTSEQKFEFASSADAKAFAELKLSSANLQTCFEAKVSDNKVVLYLVGREDSSEDKAVLTIDLSKMDGFDNAEDKIAFINEYFSLQSNNDKPLNFSNDDNPLNFISLTGSEVSIAAGNSIMNKFGLYVVDVIMDEDGKSVKAIKFGCDARRLQNYDASKKDEQGFKLTNEGGATTYMRISEELRGNGLEGYSAGVSQKVLLTFSKGGESKQVEKKVEAYTLEDLAKKRVQDLEDELKSLDLNDYFKATYTKVTDTHDQIFQVMISPINEAENVLANALKNFEAYLEEDDLNAWNAEYESKPEEDVISRLQKVLDDDVLQDKKGLLHIVAKERSNHKYKLAIEVVPFTNTVKVINREITVSVGSTSVSVNVGDCATVSSVANAIEDAIKENVSLEGNDISVSVVGKNIVFTSNNDVKITCDALGRSEEKLTDFVVKGSDTSVEIDFETDVGTIDDNTIIGSVIGNINEKLKDCDLSICYNEEGADDKYLDHLEIVGDNPFCIENFGASDILRQLGFSNAVAVKGADGKFRIVGSALSGMDFSKAFSLKEVSVYANMNLSLGTQIEALKADDFSFVDEDTKDEVKLEFAGTNIRNYNVGGFLKVGEEHYRITDVQNGYIAVSRTSYEGEELSDETAKSSDFWKKATYVASANASLGFVGMDVFASGKLNLNAEFGLEKSNKSEENNFFGFKIAEGSGITVDGEPFGLKAKADVFGTAVNLASGSIDVKYAEGELCIEPDFKVEADYTKIVDQFKNFSVEQLLAVLEGLTKNISKIIDGSNVTIPLINKSVGDLVDVAKDLQKVISEMRQQKVTSVQQFVNYLNTRLLDSIFVPTEQGKNLIDLKYEGGELYFDFNIMKKFSVRHRFDFGGSGAGINGEVNLGVSGGFWFSLSAKLQTAGGFDLLLNGDGIKFGADVEIVGDGLSFNLGIGGDDKTFENNEGILKNLIQVGANGKNAYVYGRACLDGHFGGEGFSIKDGLMQNRSETPPFECKLPIAIIGKLPITVLDVSVGDILLGKWNGNGVSFDAKDINQCRTLVEESLKDVDNSTGLYVIDLTELSSSKLSPEFSLILDDSQKPGEGKTPFVADLSSVKKGILALAEGNLSWFDKIKLGITALNTLFESLEYGINTELGKTITSVPVVGSTLSAGVDFLSVLKDKVLDPFSKFVYESTGLTAEMVAEKMNGLLSGYFRNNSALLNEFTWIDDSDWERIGNAGTWYRSSNSSAEWFFQLGGEYDWGTSLGLDFGFPGLGLEADGGLDLELNWSLDFGFGISETDGFYFIFNEGNEINVTAAAELNAQIAGSLAGLGLQLDTSGVGHNAQIGLGFGLNLADGITSLGTQTLKGTELEKLKISNDLGLNTNSKKEWNRDITKVKFSEALSNLDFSYAASVDVNAGMLVGIGNDAKLKNIEAPKFPNISGDFVFEWSKTNDSSDDGLTKLGFSNLSLDLGSFIDGVLGPIVSKIQKVVEPLEPLIDFLTTPFPVLKDVGISITPLELAKKYSKGNFDDSMIKAIKSLISMTRQISAMKKNGLNIDLGDFMLVGGEGSRIGAMSFLEGSASNKVLDSSLSSYAKKLEKSSDITAQASNAIGGQGLNVGEGEWDFIWNHPSDIFKLLMGQDIDLVHYDMPKLSFNFDWDTFVSIWGPLGARLGVTFNASINLSFGYDTLGIHQWVDSGRKDYGSFVNGFYVGDRDKDGNDINELSFYGGLTAAAEINAGVKAGVGGGVGINVGFDLYDPNKDGKIRLNEIAGIVKNDGFLGLFDVNGKITAKLYAYVDLWLTKKKWNITGDITLFSFDTKRTTSPVMISKNGNDVVANVGDNAGGRLYTDDTNISLEDGDETLKLELNDNKVKDVTSGSGETLSVDEGGRLLVNAKKGSDTIILTGNFNRNIEILGGEGDDEIDLSGVTMGEGYYVVIWGGAGNDKIKAAEGLNIIFGDDGVYTPLDNADKEKDKLAKLDKGDKIVVEGKFNPGISGDDIILGNKGNQVIIGGAGADKIRGKEGDNIILGDAGHVEFKVDGNGNIVTDSIETARTDIDLDGGFDFLFGGSGADYIVGGAGNDFIDGEAGSDTIKGERGDDYIFGGLGNDKISGGSGSDIIFGDGFGSDTFNVLESFDIDVFNDDFKKAHEGKFDGGLSLKRWLDLDDDGFDFLDIEKEISEPENIPEYGEDTINGDEGDDLIFGDAGDTDGKKDEIEGGIGNDIIDGDGGDDVIDGGIDNDVIYGGAGSDIINGGAGNDSIYGDDGVKAYESKGAEFEKDAIVFGENSGLNNAVYKVAKSTSDNAGNDVISSGPGMDFVDGQQGDDSVIVELSGGSDVNYTNVVDTGDDGENNVLTIEGTELDDKLLMRMNKDNSLGFVALLPDDSNNKNIERVNFTKGINVVNLNANGGNDKITIDGTAETTNVDAGAGDDTIQVGQLYNADMGVANTETKVKNDDLFKTTKVTTDKGAKFLSEGVSEQSTLNIEGGIGKDTFVSLHNAGDVNMAGGSGNDSFAVYAFSDETGDKAVTNGVMSIDGGKGIDSLMVRGSEAADSIVVSKQGLLSTFAAIEVAGVESKTFNAAGGDDIFNVVGSSAEETAILNGGNGNDTVAVGGLDTEQALRSSENQGQTVCVSYEILGEDGLDESNKDDYDVSAAGQKFTEKYSVLDSSSVPVVVVSSKSDSIESVDVSVDEGTAYESAPAFYVGCSGNLQWGSVMVTLRAPMLTTSELQSGDRGILIGIKKNGVVEYSTSVEVTFNLPTGTFLDKYTSNLFKPVGIYVKALSDNLVEGDLLKSISISSVWKKRDGSSINLTDSVKSVNVNVADATNSSNKENNLLTRSDEFKVTTETTTISLGDAAKGMKTENLFVYYKGLDAAVGDWSFDEASRTLSLTDPVDGATLVVNYRSDSMRIDSSKIRLAYDNVESLKLVKLSTDENNDKVILAKGDLNNKHAANVDTSMYYVLNGNTLVFFNNANDQIATLHGYLTVEFGKWMADEAGSTTAKQPEKTCDFLDIKEHSHTLVEKNANALIMPKSDGSGFEPEFVLSKFIDCSYTVTYNGDIEPGKKVRVKVTVEDALRSMKDGVSDEKEMELQLLDQDGGIIDSGDSIILKFGEGCAEVAHIKLVAKADTVNEEYGVVLEPRSDKKNIDDIEGALYAYGQGQAIKDSFSNPVGLEYRHKYKDGAEYKDASAWNEEDAEATEVVGAVSDDDSDSVDRIIVNNYDSEADATSNFKSLNARDIKEAGKLIEDYLVPLYADAEKAIIEDKDALRFTYKKESSSDSLLSKLGITMSQFEFGEFGLGTGKDKVNISKTLHRDDGFQTFTVVNTGDDKNDNREIDDEITVTDYNANDGQLVINAQGGNDKITAKGSLITKDGMVVLGGAGNDTIDVDKGIIAFGDKGNIQYKDGDKVVTELGYYGEDVGEHKAGDIIRTETGVLGEVHNLQTDGIARGATSIASVMPNEGGVDKITAGGQMSVVVGGFGGDNITVAGEKNVVLGDNGVVNFHNEGSATSWRENNIVVSLEKVQTTNNSIGEKDTIGIVGSHNVVMGGNGDDDITIGEAGKGNGTDNVVLGDGGVANFTPGVATTENFMVNAAVESVKTEEDSVGAGDTIEIYGGQNTVMGGAGADIITIGEENKDDSEEVKINGDENVVLGDGGSYVVDKDKGEVKVHTHDLSVTEDKEPDFVDTITIHGGQNTVMGGVAGDTIDIYGADNIVLGDGGESIREWNADNEVYDSIKSVKTTDDSNGGIDTINIHGGKNAVMGGAKGDKITIGDEVEEGKPQNGNENVVLGDGGSYVVDKDKGEVTVKTSREEVDDTVVIHGGEDTIKIYGGQNTVMGGAMGDGIDIYGADNIVLGDGGIAVREWNSEKKVYEAIKSVKTTDDENGGVDTINIYGGQNAVMGGFDGDNITIGTQNGATSDNNIVLGDGGEYNNEASDSAYIQTQSDGIGGEDHITVFGGHNVAMGGFAGDEIEIHGGENVVLGDGGIANYDKKPDAATVNEFINSGLRYVETTSDDIGGHDDIDIFGDTNVVMGGADGDIIDIAGNDNVVVGDGGRYDIYDTYRTVQTKSEQDGGHDVIHTNDGKNIVMGGMDSDEITTGAGNDIILGDGGFAKVDRDFNAIYVTNEGRNIESLDKDEQVVVREDGTAGADTIIAGNGDNVVFGGLDSDDITTGNGQDVVFGDNAYATFRGNANEAFEQVGDRQNVPDVYEEATLSFNFQGASQTGLNAGDFVGAYNEENGDDYRSSNWNNISGSLAGTYGNDDREVVNMDNLDATGEKSADETRVRASGVSVSYGGIESHRNTSTDNRINLQAYNLGLWNAQYDKNAKLMNSGLMTTAPNAQCENKLDVQMDGLAQYFTSYRVVVYLDIPDSHSAANNSIRKVSLYTNDSEDPIKTFYVKDNAGHNFHGSYERSTAETAASAMEANYVVFMVDEGIAADRIRVVIEEADPNAQNGKNLPGIAAIQVRGTLHKQDVAATTDIDFGGNDTIRTDLGDDIVVGGTGSDDITTFGDERYGIHDNDVVFGDNAKILLTDRDSDESTASTISTAESVAITNIDAIYDDLIKTGNGNDTVVGGIGADTINAEATAAADTMLDDINVLSINFTREHSDSTDAIAQGEAAGVVVDTDWHNFYRNDRGVIVSESVRGQESSPEYNNKMNSLSNNPTASNPYAVEEGVEVQLYGKNHGQRQTVASFTIENYDELDGDTSNSKLFNTYLAAQQSEEIVLKLKNMNSFVSNSNNTVSSTYDLYIYLGGDNNDTDTYNYLYQVKFTGHNGVSQYRYLNDWTGHKFDGDYKEATCSSQSEAERMLQMALNESAHDSAAPRLELVGNYVVFRGVSGDVADIRIRNIYTSSGQHPKNLPMISAVQVVSGDGRYAGETDLGGDHDKDLVYGDDAKLVFDMDVPYDADVADVSKFKNRVIEAKSVAIEHDAVTSISTNDTITTGRDRDVAVGGEGADTITMGAGDDIALGGSANLVLEHNNPLGVFTPNTEIALDQHTIDTTQHQNYLDNDNANVWQFQSRLDQNLIQGIDTSVSNENDRKDTIDVGEGRNLTSQGSDSTAQLVVPKPVIVDDDGQEGSGEASTPTPPVVAPDDGTVVIDQEGTSTLVEIAAGETVEIVITDWDEGNQYYHPNVFLQLNCSDNTRHKLSVTWDGQQTDPTVYLQNYAEFDIPDVATVVGEHKIVLRITSRDTISLMATVAHR